MYKLISHPLTILIVTVFCIFIWVSSYSSSRELSKSDQVIFDLKKDAAKSSKEVTVLEADLQDAKSSFSKEKIIREQLLLKKPGEYTIQLPDFPPSTALQNEKIIETTTAWDEWKKLIF
jgi:hypothetical protein